jgi:hypothetical protein
MTSNYSRRTSSSTELEGDARSVGVGVRRSEYGGSSRMSQQRSGTWDAQGVPSEESFKNSSFIESQRIRPDARASLMDDRGSFSDAGTAVNFDDSMSVSASDHTLKRKNRVTFSDDHSNTSSVLTSKQGNISNREMELLRC